MKKSNHKVSRLFLMLTIALLALAMGACMGTDNREMATPQPTAYASEQPLSPDAGAVGSNPDASSNPNMASSSAGTPGNTNTGQPKSSFDWAARMGEAVNEVNRITEISSSSIVVDEDEAIVGVTFDSSYKGQLTDRIIGMVKQKLVTLDPALQEILVTANPDTVKQIQSLSEKLASGANIDQLDDQFDALSDQIEREMTQSK